MSNIMPKLPQGAADQLFNTLRTTADTTIQAIIDAVNAATGGLANTVRESLETPSVSWNADFNHGVLK